MSNSSLRAGVLGGAIGAVLGSAAMLAWAPRSPAAPEFGPGESAAAIRDAVRDGLAPLVAELRESRGVAESATRAAGRHAPPVERPEAPPAMVARSVSNDESARNELRPPGVRWTPEPRLERLGDLRGFMDDANVRQRWLFTGQREALSWFGTPDLVYTPGGSEEIWEYELSAGLDEEGLETTREFKLMFVHGRLAQVHGDGADAPRDD